MMNELEQRIADDTRHTEKMMTHNRLDSMEICLNSIEKTVNRLMDLTSKSPQVIYWMCTNCSANCKLAVRSVSNTYPIDCIRSNTNTASWTQIELDAWK